MKLNHNEEKKQEIMQKLMRKKLTRKEASLLLEISLRQVDRLVKKFKAEGEKGLVHKSRGNPRKKKIKETQKNQMINLYLDEFFDFNFQHFYEENAEELKMSYSTMFRTLSREDVISPEAQHRTVKLYNDKMKKAIAEGKANEKEEFMFQQREREEQQKHIRKSSLRYCFGEEVQMDAAFDIWFGQIVTTLHLAVDKATKKVLGAWFDLQETTYAYTILLRQLILQYGIPKLIRTDKRGTFSINNAHLIKSNLNTTQFGRICNDLEIRLVCNSNPTFKPNVERENKTFKGRLKGEFRRLNISTIEKANVYLKDVFVPKINNRFSYEIQEEKNNMRRNPYSKEELNIILSEKFERTIDNASSIKYQGLYYAPVARFTEEIVSYKSGTKCTVIKAYDKTLLCDINEILHRLMLIEKRQPVMYQKTKKTQEEINRSKAHKPAANHPWKSKRTSLQN